MTEPTTTPSATTATINNQPCSEEKKSWENGQGSAVPESANGAHLDAHLPFWEPGSGHYGDTLGQYSRAVVDDCKELVLSFLDTIPVKKPGVFTIADYGTNDGYSSMDLFECIIQRMKKIHGENFPVQVIYEDQEKNDFNSLFNRLQEKGGFMSRFTRVYPLATNIGFYKQCVPDDTCDLIFTSMTTHWLESLDVTFKNCVFFSSLTADDHDDIKSISEATERDWITFLQLRARELKSGGLLIVLSLSAANNYSLGARPEEAPPCCDENGAASERPLRRDGVGGNDVRRDLENAWKKLKDENTITQEEFESCTAPTNIRTAREITAPFETVPSLVQDAGLSLVYHDQIFYPFFAKELWRDKKRQDGVDDRQFFARIVTSAHRTWSETTFRSSLSSKRTAEERNAILERLYASFQAKLLTVDPEDYNTDYLLSRLVVRKC